MTAGKSHAGTMVRVVHGLALGLSLTMSWTAPGEVWAQATGGAVSTGGGVNGIAGGTSSGLAMPASAPAETRVFPLSEIKRGLRGVAYTVFEGVVPEPM